MPVNRGAVQKQLDDILERHKYTFDDKIKITCLADIICNIWFALDRNCNTYIRDLESGKIAQMRCGYNRSREDAYLIAKSYFPNITLSIIDDISNKLMRSNLNDDYFLLERSFCPDINRIVHFPNTYNYELVISRMDKLKLNIKI